MAAAPGAMRAAAVARAAVQLLDIGMIIGAIKHAGNDPPLLGHAHAALGTSVFQGFLLVHRLPRRLMQLAFQPAD